MMERVWSPRLQAYHWVERKESDWAKEITLARKYEGYTYHGAHSSMSKIYDSVRDYYNSRDWN